MHEIPCSTPSCLRQVAADSKVHRIVLRDPGTHVLGVLYYCSACLEHFASYGPYRHFAPWYDPTPTSFPQPLVDEWFDDDPQPEG